MILLAWLDRVIGSHLYKYNVSYPQIPILDTNPIKLVSDWSEISSRLLMTLTTPKGSYYNAVEYFLSASQEPLCVSTGHSLAGLIKTSYTTNVIIKFGWHENQRIMLVLLQLTVISSHLSPYWTNTNLAWVLDLRAMVMFARPSL